MEFGWLGHELPPFFFCQIPRQIQIRSWRLGIFYRGVQFVILLYVIGFAVLWSKAYQKESPGFCSTVIKLKGAVFSSDAEWETPNTYPTQNTGQILLQDTDDLIDPPNVEDSFFIPTSYVTTSNQTQSTCVDYESSCENDQDCPYKVLSYQKNNINTGKCVGGHCEVFGWCPVENEQATKKHYVGKSDLSDMNNITVFIKSSVNFASFGHQFQNIPPNYTRSDLANCRYHEENSKNCPIIDLKTIIDKTIKNRTHVATKGAHIGMVITWDCDLDDRSNYCLPTYKFIRIDEGIKNTASPGYNFRSVHYGVLESTITPTRDVVKTYGLKFQLVVHAKARKFDVILLLLNLGSGVGLVSIAAAFLNAYLFWISTHRSELQRLTQIDFVMDTCNSKKDTQGPVEAIMSPTSRQIEETRVNHQNN